MRYWYLFFMFLLVIPCVAGEQQIVKTSFNVSAKSWVGGDNQSRFNLTIFTESNEDPKNYVVNNVNAINNDYFEIRMIRDLTCNETDIGGLISDCRGYFHECGDVPCKEKYIVCDSQKIVLNDLLEDCNAKKQENEGWESNYTLCKESSNSKDTRINQLEIDNGDLRKKSGQRTLYAIIGAGLMGIVYYYAGWSTKKEKLQKSREEREGYEIKNENPAPSDFYDIPSERRGR